MIMKLKKAHLVIDLAELKSLCEDAVAIAHLKLVGTDLHSEALQISTWNLTFLKWNHRNHRSITKPELQQRPARKAWRPDPTSAAVQRLYILWQPPLLPSLLESSPSASSTRYQLRARSLPLLHPQSRFPCCRSWRGARATSERMEWVRDKGLLLREIALRFWKGRVQKGGTEIGDCEAVRWRRGAPPCGGWAREGNDGSPLMSFGDSLRFIWSRVRGFSSCTGKHNFPNCCIAPHFVEFFYLTVTHEIQKSILAPILQSSCYSNH